MLLMPFFIALRAITCALFFATLAISLPRHAFQRHVFCHTPTYAPMMMPILLVTLLMRARAARMRADICCAAMMLPMSAAMLLPRLLCRHVAAAR